MNKANKLLAVGIYECDEMVEIAAHHHQFVPVEESIEEHIIESTGTIAQIPKAIVHPICMGGNH